jgi:hypothetical protein
LKNFVLMIFGIFTSSEKDDWTIYYIYRTKTSKILFYQFIIYVFYKIWTKSSFQVL